MIQFIKKLFGQNTPTLPEIPKDNNSEKEITANNTTTQTSSGGSSSGTSTTRPTQGTSFGS